MSAVSDDEWIALRRRAGAVNGFVMDVNRQALVVTFSDRVSSGEDEVQTTMEISKSNERELYEEAEKYLGRIEKKETKNQK